MGKRRLTRPRLHVYTSDLLIAFGVGVFVGICVILAVLVAISA